MNQKVLNLITNDVKINTIQMRFEFAFDRGVYIREKRTFASFYTCKGVNFHFLFKYSALKCANDN